MEACANRRNYALHELSRITRELSEISGPYDRATAPILDALSRTIVQIFTKVAECANNTHDHERITALVNHARHLIEQIRRRNRGRRA
ncbi:unnamed protein product [Caenorhabditis bovis]|uniref:Uncharacterized protein n=1 Tax=Caenorhabditis bovis TaxID=2654633 RepID=A0A8S1FGH4_9PELO|nr:unnamed protein product [Caenorhabditis bovis]